MSVFTGRVMFSFKVSFPFAPLLFGSAPLGAAKASYYKPLRQELAWRARECVFHAGGWSQGLQGKLRDLCMCFGACLQGCACAWACAWSVYVCVCRVSCVVCVVGDVYI